MLEIALCEDNLAYSEFLSTTLQEYFQLFPEKGRLVITCPNPDTLLSFLTNSSANVFFLDIDLGSQYSGFDLAKQIRQKQSDAYIIMISQHTERVYESFPIKAFDFIPKPASKESIINCLERLLDEYERSKAESTAQTITIKMGTKLYQIQKSQILYIEKDSNRCIFHTHDRTLYCYDTLDAVQQKLCDPAFIRTHKSFLVNKYFIQDVDFKASEIFLRNGSKCYIGGKYKDVLTRTLA